MSDGSLSHVDEQGRARMVDVTGKEVTLRRAVARCIVRASEAALKFLVDDEDDVVAFSRAAGILAASRTAQLVPLCHPLPLDDVRIQVNVDGEVVAVTAETSVMARTGVEMEALTACGVTSLSIVMALLPVDPAACIDTLALWEKSGGRSGTWKRPVS